MKVELIEGQIVRFRDHPKAKRNARQNQLFDLYSEQGPFTGWDNYKRAAPVKDGDPATPWALCHYDNDRIVPVDAKTRERRAAAKKVRYALYRWKTETQVDHFIAGQKAAGVDERARNPMGKDEREIVKRYKDNPVVIANGGAWGFAEKWDVDPMDPSKVYVRSQSVEKQHEDEMEAKEVAKKS